QDEDRDQLAADALRQRQSRESHQYPRGEVFLLSGLSTRFVISGKRDNERMRDPVRTQTALYFVLCQRSTPPPSHNDLCSRRNQDGDEPSKPERSKQPYLAHR
ncbi:hypothetical protein RZS08_64785, partial [Arthrospira platensis SPKY1]|nr:hypothetical protein [Arthrospira platensis SPKY1]